MTLLYYRHYYTCEIFPNPDGGSSNSIKIK